MTPWGAMIQSAAQLGMAPEAFWRLSLREWRMLTARPEGAWLLGRGDLERMIKVWPD